MSTEQGLLGELADSIADGTPVDWDSLESGSPSLAGKLRWLRVVEAISAAHRDTTVDAESSPREAPAPELPLPLHWGPLVVLERLGGGSRGTVYRARDTRLGRDVALKLLRTENAPAATVERFLDEARRLARVRHSNVLAVHGAEDHDGRPGLWTDLLEGRTLEECLREQGPFGADEAARIGIDLCHALAAVHGANLVHRDVKTANVMRERGGRIVLLDFSSVAERETPERLARRAELSGTPLFMAPELFRGKEADTRSDLYSLGVLMYRLVTGAYPVEAASFDDLVAKHERGETRPLVDARADLPEAFVRVVERALERDPARRWASAGEMERALAALVAPQPAPDVRHRSLVPTIGMVAGLAVLVAIGGGLWWWLRPLELDVQWLRSTDRGVERLLPGARVAPDDRVILEIEPNRRALVWVLSEDSRGEPCVLFPLEGLDQQNPLAGGQRHRLPGKLRGSPQAWSVGETGGTETFLVVASTHSLPELERKIEGIPRLGLGQCGPPEPKPAQTRGITGLVPEAQPHGAGPSLASLEADLEAHPDEKVRVLKVQFTNPGP